MTASKNGKARPELAAVPTDPDDLAVDSNAVLQQRG